MSEENNMQEIPKMKTNNNFNVLLNSMGNLKISENPQTSGAPLVVDSPVTYTTHQVVCQSFTWHREKHSLFDTEADD